MSKEFKRRNYSRLTRLGKRSKKKQVWRKAKGRHNKIREKRKGYQIKVMVGFKNENKTRGLIDEKKPVRIMNVKDLEKVGKNEIAVLGKVGKKNKTEIAKKAKEKGIKIVNLNVNKMLKKLNKKVGSEQIQASSSTSQGRKEKK